MIMFSFFVNIYLYFVRANLVKKLGSSLSTHLKVHWSPDFTPAANYFIGEKVKAKNITVDYFKLYQNKYTESALKQSVIAKAKETAVLVVFTRGRVTDVKGDRQADSHQTEFIFGLSKIKEFLMSGENDLTGSTLTGEGYLIY